MSKSWFTRICLLPFALAPFSTLGCESLFHSHTAALQHQGDFSSLTHITLTQNVRSILQSAALLPPSSHPIASQRHRGHGAPNAVFFDLASPTSLENALQSLPHYAVIFQFQLQLLDTGPSFHIHESGWAYGVAEPGSFVSTGAPHSNHYWDHFLRFLSNAPKRGEVVFQGRAPLDYLQAIWVKSPQHKAALLEKHRDIQSLPIPLHTLIQVASPEVENI